MTMVSSWFRRRKGKSFLERNGVPIRIPRPFLLNLEELEIRALPSLNIGATLPVENGPQSVVLADVNGDGRADLIVANSNGPDVSLLIGNGDGTFKAAQNLTTGVRPSSVAVGDFNRDGKTDLVTVSQKYSTVSIMLGNGDGTFQNQTISAGAGPTSVIVADVRGNGSADVILTNSSSGSVSVLLGNNNGTFQAAQNFTVGSFPQSVVAADFNGDGIVDLAVANESSNTVSVLLGTGTPALFQAAVNYSVGNYPESVAAADVTGDGHPDLVVANYRDSTVSVLKNTGTGTFQAAQTFATGLYPKAVAVADMNGDGKPDLVTANYKASTVSILLGTGTGSFLSAHNYASGQGPNALAIGGLNADGSLDVVVTNFGSGTSTVLYNDNGPAGTFSSAQLFTTGSGPANVVAADVNGDGRPDLVTANYVNASVSVLLGNGDGSFQSAQNFAVGAKAFALAVADLNGDGHPDIVVGHIHGAYVNVLFNNGNGTFQPAQTINVGGYGTFGVAVADFNGDNHPDIAVTSGAGLGLLLGNGNGTFVAPVNVPAGNVPFSLAAADLNGDNHVDLAISDFNNGSVNIMLGNGNGTFVAPVNYRTGTSPISAKLVDVNNDGRLDLLVANRGSSTASVLLGNGNGTFRPAQNFAAGNAPFSLDVADVNGDGHPDIATADIGSGTASILLGTGNGSFQSPLPIPEGVSPTAVTLADLNADGRPDLVVGSTANNGVSVRLGAPNLATFFQVMTSAGFTTAGTPLTITVTARDSAGMTNGFYGGTINFISSDGQFVSPGPYTFTLNDMGTHSFVVTLKTAGPQTITASDTLIFGASNFTTIFPAPASKLVFGQQPIGSIVASPLTPAVTVKVLDSFGNLTTSTASVTVAIASGPSGGTFTAGSTTMVSAINGLATFSNLGFTVNGNYTLTASSTGLASVTSSPLTISPANQRHWTGGGGSNTNWSLGVNWLENIAPTAGNDLFFPDGALTFNPNDDLAASFSVHSINFTGAKGGYDLLGSNGITLTAGIIGNAGINKVDLAGITLQGSQIFQPNSSTLAVSSAIALNSFTLTLDGSVAPTGNDTLSGVISGAGAIIKSNSSLWLVSGNNNFTGPVTINNGTLAINNSNSLGAATNGVAVNPGDTGTGSLQVFSHVSIAQPLAINGNGNDLSPGAIDIRDTTLNDTFGPITLGSAASIVSANIGVNTLTLNGAIQNGGFDLSIVGAGGFTTVVTPTTTIAGVGHVLNFGSIFTGTTAPGSITSPLNINQGTLSPGAGGTPGTLNASDVNFGIGTNFNPTLGNFNNLLPNDGTSLLNSTGSVNLSGSNLNLSFQNGFVPDPSKSYVVIQATGSINGTFNGLPDGAPLTVNGQHFLVRYINGTSSSLHPSAFNGRFVIFPQPASTTTSLFASPNPVVAGQTETLTAIVTSPASTVAGISSSVITGTVSFFDGGNLIGNRPVQGGAAAFPTTSLPRGNHTITATFSDASGTFLTSTSVAINLTVNIGSVGWQDVRPGNFVGTIQNGVLTVAKAESIAGLTAGGQWWVAVSSGSSFSNQTWGSWPGLASNFVDVQTGDFNGDGLTDIAGRNLQTGQWYVAISTGSSFTTSVWGGWNPGVTWAEVHVADFSGDGKSDIAGRILGFGQWWVATSTGSSFTNTLWTTWNENANLTWVDVKVGDFNGDGKADLTGRWLQGGSWWTALSTGSAFNTSMWASWSPAATWVDVNVGDFNGDGKADLTARYSQAGQWWTAISTGSSFTTGPWATWNANATWVDVKVGDFNGDGRADITGRWLDGGQWWTGQSTGSTFITNLWDTWPTIAATWVDVNLGDFNGDGIPDLVGRMQQNGQWWAALSNGSTSFTNQIWTTWAV
jgi:autotransporter-associated beta strand protein